MRPGAASCRPVTTANLSLLLQGHNISKSNSPSVYCLGDLSGWFREWDTCRSCGCWCSWRKTMASLSPKVKSIITNGILVTFIIILQFCGLCWSHSNRLATLTPVRGVTTPLAAWVAGLTSTLSEAAAALHVEFNGPAYFYRDKHVVHSKSRAENDL